MFPRGRSCWFFLVVAGLPWTVPNARAAEEWLPLAKGNSWVYRGPARWTDGDKVREKTLTWRMEITEVFRRGDDLAAAVVKGFPGDVAWYEPGKKPDDYLLVRVGSGKYYLLSGDEAAGMQKQFARGKKPSLKSLADNESLLLDAPLTDGKRYGPADRLHRGRYCWVAGAATPFSGAGIKGWPAPAGRRACPVDFRTNPDGQHMEIVPGVGIVGYRYEHHGTVSETDLRLVEVHLAKPRACHRPAAGL